VASEGKAQGNGKDEDGKVANVVSVISKAGPPLYIISAYISYRPIYLRLLYLRLAPYLPYMAVGHRGRLARYTGREELRF
jgi:hypothetical protein